MKEEDVKELYKLIVDAVDSAFDTYPNVLHGDIVTRVDLLPKVT